MVTRSEPGMRLGEIMIRHGALTEFQLTDTLSIQTGSDKKLGELLIDLHEATPAQVAAALREQRQTNFWLF